MKDLSTRRVHVEITYNASLGHWNVGWSAWREEPRTRQWEMTSRGVTPIITRDEAMTQAPELLRTALVNLEHGNALEEGPFD